MMRLFSIADALYWITGSIVVIGGFFVFLASVVKQIWTNAVERKAATMKNTYNYQTNIDIYNLFFNGAPNKNSLAVLPRPETSPFELLTGPVDLARVQALLRRLLVEGSGTDTPSPFELQGSWSRQEIGVALDLCRRASHSGDWGPPIVHVPRPYGESHGQRCPKR